MRSLLDAEEGEAEAEDEDEDENEAVASVEDDPVRAMVAVRRKENKFVRCIILIYIYYYFIVFRNWKSGEIGLASRYKVPLKSPLVSLNCQLLFI